MTPGKQKQCFWWINEGAELPVSFVKHIVMFPHTTSADTLLPHTWSRHKPGRCSPASMSRRWRLYSSLRSFTELGLSLKGMQKWRVKNTQLFSCHRAFQWLLIISTMLSSRLRHNERGMETDSLCVNGENVHLPVRLHCVRVQSHRFTKRPREHQSKFTPKDVLCSYSWNCVKTVSFMT